MTVHVARGSRASAMTVPMRMPTLTSTVPMPVRQEKHHGAAGSGRRRPMRLHPHAAAAGPIYGSRATMSGQEEMTAGMSLTEEAMKSMTQIRV